MTTDDEILKEYAKESYSADEESITISTRAAIRLYREAYARGKADLYKRLIDRITSWGIEASTREAPVLRGVMEIIDEEAGEKDG